MKVEFFACKNSLFGGDGVSVSASWLFCCWYGSDASQLVSRAHISPLRSWLVRWRWTCVCFGSIKEIFLMYSTMFWCFKIPCQLKVYIPLPSSLAKLSPVAFVKCGKHFIRLLRILVLDVKLLTMRFNLCIAAENVYRIFSVQTCLHSFLPTSRLSYLHVSRSCILERETTYRCEHFLVSSYQRLAPHPVC